MATQWQFRRGTQAENEAFTGAVGEITVDTTNDRAIVHDGSTAGGHPQATEAYVGTTIAATSIKGLSDVSDSMTPTDGQALIYDTVNGWQAEDQLGLVNQSFKNKLINGNFDIWQRDTSQTSSGYGSDDRWSNNNTGTTKTHSQQTFTLGQTDVSGNPKYYSRTVVTSVAGASNFCNKEQRIENVSTFSGETVTLSVPAKADATKNISVELVQNFGTGGTPSATVTAIGAQKVSLGTSWDKKEITISVPSISGKTLGTDGNDYLAVIFWFDAGSDYNARTDTLGQQSGTFDLARIQLESGSVATDFEDRSKGVEFGLCQRYYQQHDPQGSLGHRYGAGGAPLYEAWELTFPVEMRAAPTVGTIGSVTYLNCSSMSVIADSSSAGGRVTITATGTYRAFGAIYSFNSEL